MQEELKDTIQNLLNIKLPKNYENLHDLSFLLKLEEIGNIAKGNVERAKHDTVDNQLKTLDEVLEYIPSDQLKDYTICPGYYYLFLDNIKRKSYRITTTHGDFRQFLSFIDNYKDPNIISVYVNNISYGYSDYTFQLYFFYHENGNDFLTKLKTINKYCDKFLVDTTNKEIHSNFYSSKSSLSTYCNNFNFLCDYQNVNFKNNGLVITDNKLINKNTFKTHLRDNSNYGNLMDLYLSVTHIFDIETNQYLHSKVDRENEQLFNMYVKEFITPSMMNIKEESEENQNLEKIIIKYLEDQKVKRNIHY